MPARYERVEELSDRYCETTMPARYEWVEELSDRYCETTMPARYEWVEETSDQPATPSHGSCAARSSTSS